MSAPMTRTTLLAVLAMAAGPALGSPCTDRIAEVERRLDERSAAAASTSSGGQGVAAARESQAMQGGAGPVTPFQGTGAEVEARRSAAEAGGGGDRVMRARAKLNQARTLDAQGGSACMEAVAEAERELAGGQQ